jgi:hypothetical protein
MWKPIKTAPKDGTRFLGTDGTDIVIMWWVEKRGGVQPISGSWHDTQGYYTWEEEGSCSQCGPCLIGEEIAWCPLPKIDLDSLKFLNSI